MDYKEFVEELVKEIKKETGFRVEFCAADEEETQDCINVYTNESGFIIQGRGFFDYG